ncbi:MULTISPECIES: ABC transporter ATP-binding protein [unclassified Thermosynechococcus]|uniref:ABC transporter ATP-binding protein n=1 Tax=unclassified Thermosynechococcus TaxID=2622553 RepID=UPI001980D69D|nr:MULTISPECIES: ABC transporter ATP-binding protein [unclassified Thermosynechococcus]MDR5640210.1 ABC transporter ATP-binding protein [Thermosynechococcus sp. PP42]MDR7897364.1 ABC transporter ATP-binding protein [Thermosynechococcus sp. JY1332]MDR7904767.1 ABC transporter ATP-binding protein [Thermosynechococcus sp. JY1334]MDR7922999.1 ABC transporter ATP-binding protein [Thermosynechococcus sp. HY213]MDR7992592.1 ABC transporter ATP-binding protein [Thermosynechococcus sp. TG252]
MFSVHHLSYHPAATPQPILRDINLDLGMAELGLIIGPSGSGKTTLLEILAGLATPSRGIIRWQDQVLTPDHLQQLAGLVFQFPDRYFCGSTILEELRFGHPEIPYENFYRALADVGLDHLPLHTRPESLSGGQQRRLALAVQLVRQPYLLLLDEPTAGLDWSMRRQLVQVLRRLKEHWSLLVVTHEATELREISDRTWRLENGCLVPLISQRSSPVISFNT